MGSPGEADRARARRGSAGSGATGEPRAWRLIHGLLVTSSTKLEAAREPLEQVAYMASVAAYGTLRGFVFRVFATDGCFGAGL